MTPLFDKYKRLFAPFLTERGGSVCHCQWDESRDNIKDAVPDLYGSIKGHPEWRAIILINPEQPSEQNKLLSFSSNNPFDFKSNRNKELLIQKNEAPLACLTHMLAGFPSLGVKGYETGYVYYDIRTGMYKECMYNGKPILQSDYVNEYRIKFEEHRKQTGKPPSQSDIEKIKEETRKTIAGRLKKFGDDRKPKLVEVPYSPEEKAEYKKLTEEYAFNENRPTEVMLLSTREIFTADDHETIRETVRRAWQFHDEEESSDFWKIYPNTCRFICYDLINPDHTLYDRELWRFFLLALTLAVNEIPSPALQAYRLYNADLSINAEDLRSVLDGHIESLLSVQAIIQERMQRVPKLTRDKEKELVPTHDISVKFEDVDEGSVKADSDKLGLASDCPVPETKFWREYIQSTKQTIDDILSAPQEIVAAKALETRYAADTFSGKEQVLDRFQKELILKRISELEPQVMNASVYGMLNTDAYMAEMADAGAAVRKSLGLRLTKRNVLLISSSSLLVYLCGYIPYMVNSARISGSAFGASFGLTVITLSLLTAGGLLVLWFLRRRLVKKIITYNKTVRAIFDRVNRGAQVYANYFSSVCTYMYAKSLLSGVTLKRDNDYKEKKMLNAHLAFLEREIEASKELCFLHGVPSNASSMNNVFVDVSESVFSEPPSASHFYELARYKCKNTMKLTASSKTQQSRNYIYNDNRNEWDQYDTGVTLDAPYSFIVSLNIAREEIYDKKEISDKDGA